MRTFDLCAHADGSQQQALTECSLSAGSVTDTQDAQADTRPTNQPGELGVW